MTAAIEVLDAVDPTVEIADLYAKHPSIRPDWRFARVLEIINHTPMPLRSKIFDDHYVRVMRKFMLANRRLEPEGQKALFKKFPGPYHALALHEDITGADTRLFVQSRLLAKQTNAEIADATGLLPTAIVWYEKIFFGVRDRIKNRDWILRHVLGPAEKRQVSNAELPIKLMAYFGGSAVLNFMLSGARDVEAPQTPEEVIAYVMDYATDGICRRAAMAVYTSEVNKYNQEQLMDMARQVKADTKAKEDETDRQEVVATAIRHTIEAIHFIKGDMAVDFLRKHQPALLEFDNAAVELRDQQIYGVVTGNTEDLEQIKLLTMPDPPVRDNEINAKDGPADANT